MCNRAMVVYDFADVFSKFEFQAPIASHFIVVIQGVSIKDATKKTDFLYTLL